MKNVLFIAVCSVLFMLSGCKVDSGGHDDQMGGVQPPNHASVSFSQAFAKTYPKPENAEATSLKSVESEPDDNLSTYAEEGNYNAYFN